MARRKGSAAVVEEMTEAPEEDEILDADDELVELEDAVDDEIVEGEDGAGETGEYSAKDLAAACGTDARSIRKFLRSHLPKTAQPGQGGRYGFTAEEVETLKTAFAEKPAKKETPAKGEVAEDEVVDDAVEEIDFEDPTDDDLVSIEEGDEELIADELEDLDLEG